MLRTPDIRVFAVGRSCFEITKQAPHENIGNECFLNPIVVELFSELSARIGILARANVFGRAKIGRNGET